MGFAGGEVVLDEPLGLRRATGWADGVNAIRIARVQVLSVRYGLTRYSGGAHILGSEPRRGPRPPGRP